MSKVKVAKINKKGQITIPAEYRKRLKHNVVEVYIDEDRIIIKPVEDLGGILNEYAIKDKPIEKVIDMENSVASEVFLNG
ncbi:MAG: AbrB/MazE/SpoVT family DNA-binding domain-containing protein [Thermoplasmata archaeon]|jgi:AbrB family looped-hinge helix DNA binding protein|uniref:AbrB/MazE/SpoVT family DNA-binding domain-containing protein n=1 Tax=Calditerrivibrio sp. TaxID=2792612 RepID=UPI003D0F0FD8